MIFERYIPDSENAFQLPRQYRMWCYVAVTALGMLFQAAYFYADDIVDRDSVFYARGVEVWYRTGDFSRLGAELISSENTTAMKYYTAPFYLFVLKTLKIVFPDVGIETLARWWGALVGGAALCFSMLCIEMILKDDLPALLSGLMLAVHPRFAGLAYRMLRDMTYLFIVIMVLYLCLTALRKRSVYPAAAAGGLCFAGMCCRIEFLAFMAALCPLAVLDILLLRRRDILIWGVFAAFVVVGFVVWTAVMGIPWDFFLVYLRRFVA